MITLHIRQVLQVQPAKKIKKKNQIFHNIIGYGNWFDQKIKDWKLEFGNSS